MLVRRKNQVDHISAPSQQSFNDIKFSCDCKISKNIIVRNYCINCNQKLKNKCQKWLTELCEANISTKRTD